MFVAFDSEWGGEPSIPYCKGCKRPIEADDRIEEVRFDPDPVHRLEEMNGPYHARCAKPLTSLANALAMLGKLAR